MDAQTCWVHEGPHSSRLFYFVEAAVERNWKTFCLWPERLLQHGMGTWALCQDLEGHTDTYSHNGYCDQHNPFSFSLLSLLNAHNAKDCDLPIFKSMETYSHLHIRLLWAQTDREPHYLIHITSSRVSLLMNIRQSRHNESVVGGPVSGVTHWAEWADSRLLFGGGGGGGLFCPTAWGQKTNHFCLHLGLCQQHRKVPNQEQQSGRGF